MDTEWKDGLTALWDHGEDLLWTKDREGRYIQVSLSLCRLLGKEREGLLGLKDEGLWSGVIVEQLREKEIQLQKTRKSCRFEIVLPTATGEGRWFDVVLTPLPNDGQGQNLAVAGIGRDVSAQKKGDEELRIWETRYHSLSQNMLDGYVLYEVEVDDDGRPADLIVREINRAFEQITGLKRHEVLGQPMTALYPDIVEEQFDFIGIFGQVALSGEHVRVDQYLHFLHQWHAMIAYSPRPNQLVLIFADMTQTKRLSRKYKYQLHFLQEVMEAIPNPLIYKDISGCIGGCNRAFAQAVGLAKKEIVGRHHTEVLPKQVYNRFLATQAALQRNPGVQVYEYQMPYADGSVRDVIFHEATIMKENGRVDGMVGVMIDITDRKRMEEQVAYQAYHDLLTGLPNRRLYEERLRLALIQAKRDRSLVGVVFMDLAGMKQINDSQGHDAGDLILREVAHRLRLCLREGDTVARLGGDEFILLLPGLDVRKSCERITNRILATLEKPFLLEGHELRVSCSIGVSFYPLDAEDASGLIKKADIAMYRAKRLGIGQVCHFNG